MWLNRVQRLATPTHNGRFSKFALLADRVNALEPTLEKETDDELRERFRQLRMRARQGENINGMLVDAFALTREAAKRTIKQRHYDVQLVGGAAIHYRSIAEMETGEGKTLVATLPAVLNALQGKGVHVITVNDYLASRDAEWMGNVYKFLGLATGCIQTGQTDPQRRAAYNCDITYGTSKEFGFDFLRDELKRYQMGGDMHRKTFEQAFLGRGASPEGSMPVQRGHHFAMVDEADSILIDEARTPLIIGANNQPTQEEAAAYYGADELAATLVRGADFKYDPAERKAELNAAGRRKVQARAGHSAFANLTVDGLYEYVERALRAQIAYLRDRDYVAVDGEVVIVDEFTGRMMPGRQWQDGLHQAIQAKERLEITLETITAARVTVQDFFLRYKKLAGMTGTAQSDAAELRRIYKVHVFPVRTNRPGRRLWRSDRVFSTETEKFRAVADEIVRLNKKGVPVLVGTRSIEKSEKLSALLNEAGVEHQVLNAKNHAIEAQIVAQAGQEGQGHRRHQHGRSWYRHQARGRDRPERRPARHRHRAARVPPHRPPARRPLRPPGGPRPRPVLRLARRRDHRGLRRKARRPYPPPLQEQGGTDQSPHASPRPPCPAQEGTSAPPRSQAPDAVREAACRDAQEHGFEPGSGLRQLDSGG